MNGKSLIVVDANYLAWRAFYTTGGLSHEGFDTGVVFGFLRDIQSLRERYQTDQFAFCFDCPANTNLRKLAKSSYKANRDKTEEEQQRRNNVYSQLDLLRSTILPNLGFRNIFQELGYEGDDLIASITKAVDPETWTLIVSGDADLFQLIQKHVTQFDPRKGTLLNLQKFRRTYGIHPDLWSTVKAMCGCVTDNVKGIAGVGEKTALKYLRGEMKEESKIYKMIESPQAQSLIQENMLYVDLPYKDCPTPRVREQKPISEGAWRDITRRLGIRVLFPC